MGPSLLWGGPGLLRVCLDYFWARQAFLMASWVGFWGRGSSLGQARVFFVAACHYFRAIWVWFGMYPGLLGRGLRVCQGAWTLSDGSGRFRGGLWYTPGWHGLLAQAGPFLPWV
jgi:hypothetical protein